MIAKLKLTACVVSLAAAIAVLSPGVSSMLGLTGGEARGQYQFGPASELVIPGNSPNGDLGPALSSDNLTLYFASNGRSGGLGGRDLYQATRTSPTASFGAAVNLGAPLNTSVEELIPKTSLDGLSLYFVSNRPGTLGNNDIWLATRASTAVNFGAPVNLGAPINTSSLDGGPDITADGLTLVFNSDRPGGSGSRDLYIATRASTAAAFGSAVNLGPTINTSDDDYSPSISADGLRLFFTSTRPGGFGDHDLWVTTRASLAAPWGAPVNLGPDVNGPFTDYNPEISWDGSRLVFTSTRSVGGDGSIYEVTVVPEPGTFAIAIVALIAIVWKKYGTASPLASLSRKH
jgi:Tol biopolymer transport system component